MAITVNQLAVHLRLLTDPGQALTEPHLTVISQLHTFGPLVLPTTAHQGHQKRRGMRLLSYWQGIATTHLRRVEGLVTLIPRKTRARQTCSDRGPGGGLSFWMGATQMSALQVVAVAQRSFGVVADEVLFQETRKASEHLH